MKKVLETMKTMPPLWEKCPGCKELIYAKEFVRHNKCPKCEYIFPYPFAKAWELEKLLRSGKATWKQVSDVTLVVLDSMTEQKVKSRFLTAIFRIVDDHSAWSRIQKKSDGCFKREAVAPLNFDEGLREVEKFTKSYGRMLRRQKH